MFFPELTWRWSPSTISVAWATTTAASRSSTHGKRRRAIPHGGAQTVDYEKIAATAVQAMTAADLHRFLVVCALVSDLYCPGYNPRQPLEKDSNLERTAARYNVGTPNITSAVKQALSAGRVKVPQRNAAKSPTNN